MRRRGGGFYATAGRRQRGRGGEVLRLDARRGREGVRRRRRRCARRGAARLRRHRGRQLRAHRASDVLHVAKPHRGRSPSASRWRPTRGRSGASRARAPRCFARREKRPEPFRDEKILALWNGLAHLVARRRARACSASRGGSPSPSALSTSSGACSSNGASCACFVTRRTACAKGPGFLDDQAFVACAALDLYEATGDAQLPRRRVPLADTIRAHFLAGDGAPLPHARRRRGAHRPHPGHLRPRHPQRASMAHLVLLRLGAVVGREVRARSRRAELERAGVGRHGEPVRLRPDPRQPRPPGPGQRRRRPRRRSRRSRQPEPSPSRSSAGISRTGTCSGLARRHPFGASSWPRARPPRSSGPVAYVCQGAHLLSARLPSGRTGPPAPSTQCVNARNLTISYAGVGPADPAMGNP